jgi:CubicO group peptidase (beta-lactamase class C family)
MKKARMTVRRIIVLLVLSVFAAYPLFAQIAPPEDLQASLQKIRSYIEPSMKAWGTPGLAVGIVKDGRVILAQGFGRRDVEKDLPVTSKTRFILGSTTKAFTTMAMGILVDEGKLDWDRPVSSYLPQFRLMNEYAALHATPRDLVTHRTGLPRHDFIWSNTAFSLPEVFESLQFLEPSRDLRTAYQYNNLMYIAAGYLVGRVADSSWEEVVRERIFKPLGMADSGCTVPELLASPEFSFAYERKKGELAARPFPTPDDVLMYGPRASGSVNTTAEDMCKWMLLHLNKGMAGGQRVISAANLLQMHTPQVTIPWRPNEKSEFMHPSYGLGWSVDSYRGRYRVHHGGATMGFFSYVSLFPHENLGIVVLANMGGAVPAIIANYASDVLLGLEPLDWNKKVRDMMKAEDATASPEKRVEGTKPSHKLEDYAGEYSHPAYGRLKVEAAQDALTASWNRITSLLEHWHYETFRTAGDGLRSMKLTFQANARGEIISVSAPLEPAVKEIVFQRVQKR